jgi:hypothetical protein
LALKKRNAAVTDGRVFILFRERRNGRGEEEKSGRAGASRNATLRELAGESLEGRQDAGHVSPDAILADDEFRMTIGVDGEHALDPRAAVSMRTGNLFALAGKPLPPCVELLERLGVGGREHHRAALQS